MRNMKMSLIYEIRKHPVAEKKAGQGCGDRFLQLFCRTAALPLPDLCNSVGQVLYVVRVLHLFWRTRTVPFYCLLAICVGDNINAVTLKNK